MPHAFQRALAAFHRGQRAEAERLCRAVLAAAPDHFGALYLSGIVAGQTGRAQAAAELMSKAVAVNPGSADAHFNRGVALGQLGRLEQAVESYERAIALRPAFADAHYNRGAAMGALEHHAEALASYGRAIALQPDHAQAHLNRGIELSALKRPAEALASYERAIALNPNSANARNNRGVALDELGRVAEALESYESALALRPDYPEACNNRGVALLELDRAVQSLDSCERAIALMPGYADAWYNRGNALRELHRHAEAAASYERATAIQPDHAAAHWNLADCRLLLGDFERGWQEYEWRWSLGQPRSVRRDFPQPLWLGSQPLDGRTILLHSELGLGDTLQFCRYARDVAARGARVVLEVQAPLLRLLSTLEGVAKIVSRGDALPAFDFHCPLMSLPLAFKTDLGSVPARIPYLRSDASRVASWRGKLGERKKPRVALVWSGSRGLRNDKRSMTLEEMLPLLCGVVEWLSLQKEVPDADATLLASRSDILHVGDGLDDFADTAAAIELSDLLVTVDTSVAHVAGALGKPVWILLPFNPHDWRWLLDREDSAWYPTARLFRQPAPGDWAGAIRRAGEELARRLGAE